MKKQLFLFIVVIIFVVGSALTSPSITVTNPHSGSVWYKAHFYTITWNKIGKMNDHVKIRLYQNGKKILKITNSTMNNGFYKWLVPAEIQSGNYVIRVKTTDNKVYDDSEPFTITDYPSPSKSLSLIKPAAGDCWEKGNTYTIQWNSFNISGPVKIGLYKGGNHILSISDSTDNDGSFSWTIPSSLYNGNYWIRIEGVNNKFYARSDVFNIADTCGNGGGLKLNNLNYVVGLDSLKLAIFLHGPGPNIKEFGMIRAALEKNRVKGPVTVKLYQGNREVANLGTFAPTVRSGRVRFNTMPSVLNLNLAPKQKAMMAENPQRVKLVLFSGDKIIGISPLKVVVGNNNIRKSKAMDFSKIGIIKGAKLLSCPDPAVVDIKFSVKESETSPYRVTVKIISIVKNIGGADYISGPNQQVIVLDKGDAAHPLKVKKFQNLRKGEEVRIVYETNWTPFPPSIGEFSPTFRVYITYAPDIKMDNNKKNDDCNLRNNSMSKSGKIINDMLRR